MEEKAERILNNFWCWLPGASYRDFRKDEAAVQLFKKIDELLLTEQFKGIVPAEIVASNCEANRYIADWFNGVVEVSDEEFEAWSERNKIASQQEDDLLRPLCNKLESLGFSWRLLTA